MTTRIAVINDKMTLAKPIVAHLNTLACEADAIIGLDSAVLFKKIKRNIVNKRIIYDGVVLDILFAQEPLGGLELWDKLVANGLADALGRLMVLSNSDQENDIIRYFRGINKEILLMSAATTHSTRLPQHLAEFVDKIRNP